MFNYKFGRQDQVSLILDSWVSSTAVPMWVFMTICWMDAFECPASPWSWAERQSWGGMLGRQSRSSSRWRGWGHGSPQNWSVVPLWPLLLSFLVKKKYMAAVERDVHCLFVLFVFAWLKYFGRFLHLVRVKIAFILLTPRGFEGRRLNGGQQEKMLKVSFWFCQSVSADVRMTQVWI